MILITDKTLLHFKLSKSGQILCVDKTFFPGPVTYFDTLHEGFKGIFADHLHMTARPGLPLVKSSFKSKTCYSQDFTVPVQTKDYLLLTQHCTVPILPSVAIVHQGMYFDKMIFDILQCSQQINEQVYTYLMVTVEQTFVKATIFCCYGNNS